MDEPPRIIALRQANEIQPCGVDSYGFPVGQFARELDALRRANADLYALRRNVRRDIKRALRR